MKKFKVWNRIGEHWIEENIDDFVEIDWMMPGHYYAGECFVRARRGMNVEIAWQDNDGDFTPPK